MIKEFFKGKRVLVTGGTGLIGRSVINELIKCDAEIIISTLDDVRLFGTDYCTYRKGDLTDFGFCKALTHGVDYVFHLAGIKGSIDVTINKPASFFVPLLMMNTNLLEAARINKVNGLVFTSSIGAYPSAEIFFEDMGYKGTPMDFYPGWAKRMAEFQIETYKKQFGLKNFSIVRPCNVYGPGDNFDPENAMVIPSLISKIVSGNRPVKIWGDGSAIRDFAYSDDIAHGIINAMVYQPNVAFLNLGSGIGYSVKQLVETLYEIEPFEYVWDVEKGNGFPKRVMDISLAKQLIHYNPTTTLKQGLEKTFSWFLDNQQQYLKRHNYFTHE